jgi:hypothetical protein
MDHPLVDGGLAEALVIHVRQHRSPVAIAAGWCAASNPVLVPLRHGGGPSVRRVSGTSGVIVILTETEHSQQAQGLRPGVGRETHRMSRYKDLAIRLAVVVAFVLVLAAPLRW